MALCEPASRDVLSLLNDGSRCVKMAAPMVRYSKLPFRLLVREFGCDVAYTPMIIADSFVRSEHAREAEFTTCRQDRPLIVQFAASDPVVFGQATELISSFADGVDLNCGCPQRWAVQSGLGTSLLTDPEKVKNMVRAVASLSLPSSFTTSIKIRLQPTISSTIDFCRQLEAAGVSFISVHGRKAHERPADPCDYQGIQAVKEAVSVPVVANGDVKSLEDFQRVAEDTGVDGIMVARGLLKNPCLFQSSKQTPVECVLRWTELAHEYETSYSTFHHHLMFMCSRGVSKANRKLFNALQNKRDVLECLERRYGLPFTNPENKCSQEILSQ